VSNLLDLSPTGAVFSLSSYEEIAMSMRMTERDIQVLELLAVCGWLSTRQIQYSLFPETIAKVVNKRMRKLTEAGYVHKVRLGRTDQNLYRCASGGKKALCRETDFPEGALVSLREPPKELSHFMAINDFRLVMEAEITKRGGQMRFFFSDMELRRKAERCILIPDAMVSFILKGKEYQFAFEYDNGTETPTYFSRQKVRKYLQLASASQPIFSLNNFRVLVVTNKFKDALKLMRAAVLESPPAGFFYFAGVGDILSDEVLSDIFLDPTELFSVRRGRSRPEVVSTHNAETSWYSLTELVCRGGVSTRHEVSGNPFDHNEMPSSSKPNIPILNSLGRPTTHPSKDRP
jgi:hypothetical protein